jgi:hypothetical protein
MLSVIMLNAIMLNVIMQSVFMKSVLMLSTECHYVECRNAECHYADCLNPKCHYAECHYADCHYPECCGAFHPPPHFYFIFLFKVGVGAAVSFFLTDVSKSPLAAATKLPSWGRRGFAVKLFFADKRSSLSLKRVCLSLTTTIFLCVQGWSLP